MGFFGPGVRIMGGGIKGAASGWTPESPTSDGGVSPHTWHYASVDGNLFQDSGKTTVADADGDPVGASVNQGSDSHDITQGTSAKMPTLKTGALNDQPVFRFDGGDWFQGAFNGALTNPFTMFVVATLATGLENDNNNYELIASDDATNFMEFRKSKGTTPDSNRINAGAWLQGADSDDDWHIHLCIFDGLNSALYTGGGPPDGTGDAGTHNPDGLTLGAQSDGTTGWIGDVAHLLIYDSVLSIADINQNGNYLNDLYALPWDDVS
jgi:hypothetical protein